MTVSRGGSGSISEYRDVEVQSWRGTHRVQANDAGNNAYTQPAVFEFQPANGIHRDEEAELVGYRLFYVRTEIDQNVASTTGNGALRGGWELSLDDDPILSSQDRTTVEFSAEDKSGSNPEGGADTLSRQVVSDDPNTLGFWHLKAEGGDTGGYLDNQAFAGSMEMNFREYFGAGPVLLDRDEIYLHSRHNAVEMGLNCLTEISGVMYWDVRDRQ